MTKRWRLPKIKDGELLVYYGKDQDRQGPDVCFWAGPGCDRSDARLMHYALCTERMCMNFDSNRQMDYKFDPSLIKELESRGYDLSTLKFSIQKKAQ